MAGQTRKSGSGAWVAERTSALEVGDEVLVDGHVLRLTEQGFEDRGDAAVGRLSEADGTWVEGAAPPTAEAWVLVLGDQADAGHWRLNEFAVGARFAHGGRVYVAGLVDSAPAVRSTGEVLGRVAQTFIRRSDTMVDLVVAGPAGEERISGTPEHPFWVEALGDWVPLGELEAGTVLTAEGGGTRVVRSLAWREGSFEVFNFEVEGVHDYFVASAGLGGRGGVLVHNSCDGSAVFKKHVGQTGNPHVTVEIRDGSGKSLGEFHQVDHGSKGTAIEAVSGRLGSRTPQATLTVKIKNPEAAAKKAASDSAPSGQEYSLGGNDCVQAACDVANGGQKSNTIKPAAVRGGLGM